MDVLKAWEDIRECRNVEGEFTNPIIFNNRNVCFKGKMIFDTDLFEKDVYLISHIWNKGRVKSVETFLNLGMKSKELSMIIDLCNAIPDDLKDENTWYKFQNVDMVTFEIELKVLGQKINSKDRW